ncbi:MAG: hypothetical protein JJ966_05720 [Balneolaceae bacterium]|nr:hypothetical protein [Balneolaceae bacterium]
MKNRTQYLLLVFLPLVLLYFLGVYVSSTLALCLLAIYTFVYRSFLDSKRLYELGEISDDEFFKWWIPFYKSWWYPITHFKKLYLG